MSITYGFYNGLVTSDKPLGDRLYDATTMSKIFDGIINDGIFMSIGDKLMVKAHLGMTVNVGIGRAWFNHTWTYNDAIHGVDLDPSEVVLNRIDSVILEVNHSNAVRANTIKVLKGNPASTPKAPTLIKSLEVTQHALCDIYVSKGVKEITQANITNRVGTKDTPFVTGILETMNIDALIAQWGTEWDEWNTNKRNEFLAWIKSQEDDFDKWVLNYKEDFTKWSTERRTEFDEWFNLLQITLDGDVAGKLFNLIEDHKNERTIAAHLAKNIKLENPTEYFKSDNVEEAMGELFQNVSDGKNKVASAITDKKIPTSGSDSFDTMSKNINKINVSKYDLSKMSTYELMMRYNFDPIIALGLTPGGE